MFRAGCAMETSVADKVQCEKRHNGCNCGMTHGIMRKCDV
jgi:hypothetical protein